VCGETDYDARPDWESRHVPQNFRVIDWISHHLIHLLLRLPSRKKAKMSMKQHESATHHIGFDPSASSPARVQQGVKHGYFDDKATKTLLGLDDDDVPLNAGTYGRKSWGKTPSRCLCSAMAAMTSVLCPSCPSTTLTTATS
jgi:hypothetical protein